MKKILLTIFILSAISCQQEDREIISNYSYSGGLSPDQFESKVDKAVARAFVKEFGSGGGTQLNWIAVNEPLIKQVMSCKSTYGSTLDHYDGLIKGYKDLTNLTDDEILNISVFDSIDYWKSSPAECPEAVSYFPNCRDIETKIQFINALKAMKEVNEFFWNEGLNPGYWDNCATGMDIFFESKGIVMSDCDLLSNRPYELHGEVGVMQNEFCYVEGTKYGNQKDISEYKPGLQR